jgi:hypothetical protein
MKKYLVSLQFDVADEGDVGMIGIYTEDQLKNVKSVSTGFGNIDGDDYPFDKETDAVEITNEEIKVLKKFGLTNLSFGYCDLSNEEPYNEDDEDDDEY